MLTTAFSIFAAIALLMPGFVIAELSLARSARSSRSDLGLALRAVAYALVVHLAFCWWTADVVDRVGKVADITDHLGAVALYVGAVLIGIPVGCGLFLNRLLARAELRDGLPGSLRRGLEPERPAMHSTTPFNGDGKWVLG
ncbi:MAG: hypothetical protein M3350_06355 [Actinomycetota bacterium]|nr:hypothetical protein [Actinomycetota bacterium]